METPNIYKEIFLSKVAELRYTVLQECDNTFSLNLNEVRSREIKIRLIVSEPIIERIHGSKNNTKIKAIGFFKFKFSPEGLEPNFYAFAFTNTPDKKVEFVVIPCTELKNRLDLKKCNTNNDQKFELVLWILPDDYIFETTHIGAEGEWWFIAGGMAKDTHWDYTKFRNSWDSLIKC